MKLLILAGGHATRLWPITKTRAKPLLPLASKPILDYILNEAEEMEDVESIIIATNEKFEDEFREYISGRGKDIYELVIEGQESEEEKYGAVGGIINVIEKREKDDYLVIGGDNYYSFGLDEFVKFCRDKKGIGNACFRLGSLEEAKHYGVAEVCEDDRIDEFQEKPDNPKSRMASTACYFFPEKYLRLFDEYVDYWKGKIPEEKYLDETGRFVQWAVERYPCFAYVFQGKWMDIGTRGGYLRAEKKIREGNIVRSPVEGSEIGDNVTILEDCEIRDSEIENSIIFPGCKIKDCIIVDSIIGKGTELINGELREGIIAPRK